MTIHGLLHTPTQKWLVWTICWPMMLWSLTQHTCLWEKLGSSDIIPTCMRTLWRFSVDPIPPQSALEIWPFNMTPGLPLHYSFPPCLPWIFMGITENKIPLPWFIIQDGHTNPPWCLSSNLNNFEQFTVSSTHMTPRCHFPVIRALTHAIIHAPGEHSK